MSQLDADVSAIRDRIRDLITKSGVADQRVAFEIGKSKSYISNILSGRNNPSIEAICSLCENFGISLKDFFDFESENPMIDASIVAEIKRLSGDHYESLPGILKKLSEKDAQTLLEAYRILVKSSY